MSEKEFKAFDRELPHPPRGVDGARQGFSSGTAELMAIMTGQPNVTASRG